MRPEEIIDRRHRRDEGAQHGMKHDYEVKIDQFEGPLDLLLYLVTKAEIDIAQISVSQVTKQYLEYLELLRELNIDVAAEYLHMAATLLRLKARELLPQDTPAEVLAGAEDEIYTREQLIQQLLEYKKYKEAAGTLKGFEAHQIGTFARGAAERVEIEEPDGTVSLGNITLFDILSALKSIMARQEETGPLHVVRLDVAKIDDRIERILGLLAEKAEVRFEELFTDDLRRITIVVTFMAMLELVKMQEIRFRQEERFGPIFVTRRDERDREILADPDAADEPAPQPTEQPG